MPTCSIYCCRNSSTVKNVKNGGISYHRFPDEPKYKVKWAAATGRPPSWIPTKSSTVCSLHFTPDCYKVDKIKHRLYDNAIPTLHLCYHRETETVDETEETSPKKRCVVMETETTKETEGPSRKKICVCDEGLDIPHEELVTAHAYDPSSVEQVQILPWEKIKLIKLSSKRFLDIISRKNIKIKALQARNRRQKKKITSMEARIKQLQART